MPTSQEVHGAAVGATVPPSLVGRKFSSFTDAEIARLPDGTEFREDDGPAVVEVRAGMLKWMSAGMDMYNHDTPAEFRRIYGTPGWTLTRLPDDAPAGVEAREEEIAQSRIDIEAARVDVLAYHALRASLLRALNEAPDGHGEALSDEEICSNVAHYVAASNREPNPLLAPVLVLLDSAAKGNETLAAIVVLLRAAVRS